MDHLNQPNHGIHIFTVGVHLILSILALVGQRLLERPDPNTTLGLLLILVAALLLIRLTNDSTQHMLQPVEALPQETPLRVPFNGWLLLGSLGITLMTLVARAAGVGFGFITAGLGAGMVLFLLACWQADRGCKTWPRLQLNWSRRESLLLAGILLIGAAARLVQLEQIPRVMSGDEGPMGMEALRVMQGEPRDPFATGWLTHPNLWFYLQSLSLRLFGDSLAGLRTLSALIGTATIATTYLLARLLYGRRIAVIAAGILATYHYHIHVSRLALNNVIDPLFGTMSLSFLTIGLKTKRRFPFGLLGITTGLAFYGYHGARLFLPLVIIAGFLQVFSQFHGWSSLRARAFWQPAALVLVGFLIAAGPLLQTFAREPILFGQRFDEQKISLAWLNEQSALTGTPIPAILLNQLKRAALAFNSYPATGGFYYTGTPLLWGLPAALMLLGFFFSLCHARQWTYQAPLLWYGLAIFFGGVLFRANPASNRLVTLIPVVCLFMAISIAHLFSSVAGSLRWRRHTTYAAIALLVGALALTSSSFYLNWYLVLNDPPAVRDYAANALGRYLQQQPADTFVWFLGPPEMSYHGYLMLDFLSRDLPALDAPITIHRVDQVPRAAEGHPTVYAVMPVRQAEIAVIKQRYPNGQLLPLWWWNDRAEPSIYVYQVQAH